MSVERPHATLYALALAICVLSVAVFQIIMYEHPNVLFESLTLKMEVKNAGDLDDSRPANVHIVNMLCAKRGASRSSCLFEVHNHAFREGRTDASTHVRTHRLPVSMTPFQIRLNDVKIQRIAYNLTLPIINTIERLIYKPLLT